MLIAPRRDFESGPWRKLHASERSLLPNRLADLIEKRAGY
jgi:hypothetical protein